MSCLTAKPGNQTQDLLTVRRQQETAGPGSFCVCALLRVWFTLGAPVSSPSYTPKNIQLK